MDLARPAKTAIATTYAQWPKCYRCSLALGRTYPVERYIVLGRERSRTVQGKYELVLDVACTHGEARRVALERESPLVQRLRGLDGGSLGGIFPRSSEQRVRLEIPVRWGGLEREDGHYQASAAELAACGRIYAFAPGAMGKHGVRYFPSGIPGPREWKGAVQ